MIITTLHLTNNGILKKCWFTENIPNIITGSTTPKFIIYANIGRVGLGMGHKNIVHQVILQGNLTNHIRLGRVRVRVGFQSLCDKINKNLYIESIHFSELHSSHMKFCRLLSPLFVRNSLQEIGLRDCGLSEGEEHLLATALKNRETPLNLLSYQTNSIINLARAFHDKPGLFPKKFRALITSDDRYSNPEECESIAHILRASQCSMEELSFKKIVPIHRVANTFFTAIFFAKALAGNKTLYELDIGPFCALYAAADAFVETVCNTSTIHATYTSNHTLARVPNILIMRTQEEHHSQMMQYFEMNRNGDKKFVACQKVLMHHFSGQFSMKDFEDMMAPDLLIHSLIFLDRWGRTYTSSCCCISFNPISPHQK
jgi:hypothetical protein